MPSATSSEEPRYNGLETQRQPVSSINETSTCNGRGNKTSQTVPDSFDNFDINNDNCDPVPHIDPPRGFEPTPTNDNSKNNDDNENVPSQSASSTIHLPSSSTNGQSENNQTPDQNNGNVIADSTEAQSNDYPMILSGPNELAQGSGTTTSGTTTTSNSSSSRAIPNNNNNNDQDNNNHDNHQDSDHHDNTNNHNSNHQASTSFRLVNGLNNIVTRISKVFANTSLSMMSTDRCLQDEPAKFAFGNRRALEKTWKLMDKVVKCCQHPRMNLNNSPPFILEILPETYQHLKLIHTKYDSQPINDQEYSQIFLRNLQNRCEQTLKLFKDARDEMYDEDSEYRHKLTRNTLVFNHILSELRAIFPAGLFIGDKYLITKKESAGEFWRNSFASDIMVDWKTFYHALQQVHSIDSSFFSLHALKQTIDLTCDDHISVFEFDVFTRLFQPWSTLLKNWQTLAVTHPGYKAFLTYDELKARLQKHISKPGSYVFRLSCTRLGQWAIGYVTRDGQILQTIVQNISLSQALTETEFYVYPDGKDEDPELRDRLCSGMTGDERNVTVTEEQYEIYCGVGNSFQTCKICFENDKDIRVEPCNHLLCTSCLLAWQESEGQGCPYCRTEIKETVIITMDLPKSSRKG